MTSPSKRVVLAISSSIAAYKAADIVSQLTKKDYEVQCLLTPAAREFVSPLVLETLSGRPALSELWGTGISGTEHIRIARWADQIVFAPATANLIAKLSLGLADDLVTTVALATSAPWLIAPAMNTVMLKKETTQAHLAALSRRGAKIVEPDAGLLACGEEGEGKLASVERLVAAIDASFAPKSVRGLLAGKRILITAGPTTTWLDPVRYLTNPSTGKMGAALAEAALALGASVDYVLGVDKGVVRPEVPADSRSRFRLAEVHTAQEMLEASLKWLPDADGVIAAAAVMDYEFETQSTHKLKRASAAIELKLLPSPDVLATLRGRARDDQWFLGFAAETEALEANALKKLESKAIDFVFVNAIAKKGEILETGFGTETNSGVLLGRAGLRVELARESKRGIAERLLAQVAAGERA